MPTGYTAAMAENITFDDFVMSCARAMGALVMMRDEPFGAPIPERFEPSDYHAKKIAEATITLGRLASMTEADAEQSANEAYEAAVAAQAAAILRNDTLREKYNAMLAKVGAWQAPSADHDGLKKFMVDQITSSIDFDCDNRYYRDQKHTKLTGAEWLAQEEAKARKDIAYHEAENAKEIERTEARNTWLRQLRESLKTPNPEKEIEMQTRYSDGETVRINKPTLREHGVTGTVKSYDDVTQWYWVELDQGPPWRGKYEHSELETPNVKVSSLPHRDTD